VLTVRGTGSNNHLPAEVRRNNVTILKRDNFRGLYLHVFTRYDLTSVFSDIYDTAVSEAAANSLAAKISSFDSTYLIVVVSCRHWESSVTSTLVTALENCGAILVKEVITQQKYRPYAFVGVPGLGKTQGHSRESLRTNKGYYLYDPRSTQSLPCADLRVVLERNPWRQFFFMLPFDTWRRYDPVEDYFGALSYQIELLLEANETTSTNIGFAFKQGSQTFVDSRSEKLTELDKVWVGSEVARYDFDGEKYSDGAYVEGLAWTTAVKELLNGGTCEPPYTDTSKKACLPNSDREQILQCGVGITPWDCAYLGESQISTTYP
jgi:hypothetical protein